MSKLARIVLLLVLIITSTVIAAPVGAAAPNLLPVPGPCVQGDLPHGALSLICIPSAGWNGDLVVWGHGYVAPDAPLDFYNLTMPDGTYLPTLVQSLGYAFATTSYRRNGLAILEGVDDVRELVAAFPGVAGTSANRTYMIGASEGGAITTLLVERSPELFSGGLSLCGPIGDFRKQLDYWGDFRVLFDYFFPDALPPTPMSIPQEVMDNWESVYVPAIAARLAADPVATAQLIRTSKAAVDKRDPTTAGQTTVGLLWYNVHATNDGTQQLDGNPFDNLTRIYTGSLDDVALNQGVWRTSADPTALAHLWDYQTSGYVGIPLVTMHTTGDEIVPYWHQTLYGNKAATSGSRAYVTLVPVKRYGHCNFKTEEVLAAFALLVLQTTGYNLDNVPAQYDVLGTQAEFTRAQAEFATQGVEQ